MGDRPTALREHMADPTSDVAIRRRWEEIDRALDGKRPRWRRAIALGGTLTALAAAAAIGFVWLRPVDLPSQRGATLRAGTSPMTLALSDGSRAELTPASEVFVEEDAAHEQVIHLRRGAAVFDVVPRTDRTFEVLVAGATVRVLGTRFRVTLDEREETRLDVEVMRGHVRVSVPGMSRHDLTTGQRLSLVLPSATEAPIAQPETAQLEDALEVPTPATPDAPSAAPSPTRRPRAVSPPVLARSAEVLFAEAQRARRDGRPGDAADLYEALTRAHPSDRRAAVAAFERGRILLDELSDPEGAVRAFTRAAAMRGPHREDARARIVEAYERIGNRALCTRAQRAYLTQYPEGVHAERVRARCTPH